ncbi:MAG: FAD-dependent oxidoreductase [Burkholderiaceae bacterium]
MAADNSRPGDFDQAEQPYDLCIVGAGIAGLNALFVATQYLPKTARVALIDRHATSGGMWNTAYPYVRLHQPHPMFTVGNMKWQWNKPKDYLATRDEVLVHLEYCLAQLRQRVRLTELYGHSVVEVEEVLGEKEFNVKLTATQLDEPNGLIHITSKKLIEASGFDVPQPSALSISSQQVHSVAPQDLDMTDSKAPVYVVGGGKTGMDTVLEVLRRSPECEVSLINGRGTVYVKREIFAPKGLKNWRQGVLLSRCLEDLALRYNGKNAEETFEYFRQTYSVEPTPNGDHNLFGFMSEEESNEIAAGLTSTHPEYLVDVRDTDDGPQMVFKSGKTLSIAPGSTVVNCTGHLYRESKPMQPYLSAYGNVLRVNTRSAIHFLTTVSAYFLTHMFYLGRLPSAELYALDSEALFHKNRKDWHLASLSLGFINLITVIDTLPFKALDQCGQDLDRWFPLHRRVAALLNIKMNKAKYFAHCQASLDTVRERHQIACGPLTVPPESSDGKLDRAGLQSGAA